MTQFWCDAPGVMERGRQMYDAGLSMSEIARHLGVSKNAVVGKFHRAGFPPRPSPIVRTLSPEEVAQRAEQRRLNRVRAGTRQTLPALQSLARKAPTPPTLPPAPAPKREPVVSTKRCEYRSGANKPFKRCEAMAVPNYPYCETHCKTCFINWPLRAVDSEVLTVTRWT